MISDIQQVLFTNPKTNNKDIPKGNNENSSTHRLVKIPECNLIYYPKETGKYKTTCIVISLNSRSIVTFYNKEECPALDEFGTRLDKYRSIDPTEAEHTCKIHKHIMPNSDHGHFEISEEQNLTNFLNDSLFESLLEERSITHIYCAINFLARNKNEPGVHFKDGSIAINSLNSEDADGIIRMHGPLKFIDLD